jgi:hypothetical protein
VKLTTHLRLVPRSKNGWSCTSTPPMRLQRVVITWGSAETTFYIYVFIYSHVGFFFPLPLFPYGARIIQRYSAVLQAGRSGVRVPARVWHFSLHPCIHTSSGAGQPPIKLVRGTLSLGSKRAGREADNSTPSSAEVKNARSLHDMVLS